MIEAAQAIADARPQVVAALAVHFRNLDLAEDAFADAAEACLKLAEAPGNVAGWLNTAAQRKAIDTLRKRDAEARAADGAAYISDMENVLNLPEPIADERLRLIFICCHPAIALEARAALALKVICGLPVAEIAKVFLTGESTMFQRITRAKRKVQQAGIAFELPPRRAWAERLDAVLLTLELAYTLAYQDAAGEIDSELSGEIGRLAAMVAELLPTESEALGLSAMIMLARSRETARLDGQGEMIPLSRQDTSRWDLEAIEVARRWLDEAAALQSSGPYQVMAAIQLTHARRAFDGKTDWASIVRLYDALLMMRPSAMVAVNRALALAQVKGADAALAEITTIKADKLQNARPFHTARAELLAQSNRKAEAAEALKRAIALDPPRAERLFMERKLAALLSQA